MMNVSSGWESILQSPECRKVLERVAALRKKSNPVYPSQKNVFRAFRDCSFEKVRVVILGQDPYFNKGQAIGRAFAVPKSTKVLPRSLENIFKAVLHDHPGGLRPEWTLESWAKQGVLLLNTTLTVEDGSPGGHAKAKIGWKKAVTIPTLQKLSDKREHLVFMLWGRHAKSFEHILDPGRHRVLKSSHPSPRRDVQSFRECGHFHEANKYLSEHGIERINWTT